MMDTLWKLLDITLVLLLMFSGLSSKPLPLQNRSRTKYSLCPEPFSQNQLGEESRPSAKHQHALASLRAELKWMKLQGSAAPRGSAGQARCGLRQVQVKVSELGLGYPSQEELVFRYCSGLCLNSISNYDKILTRLAANHRSPLQGAPPTACCRPTAYERRLAFLDDNLRYHVLRKHSARRCGCV